IRTAVHNVVVELRMLARPLEIRSSPHPMETHGITALVIAMIPNPINLPRHPGPNSGLRRATTITARAANPEAERNRSKAVGLMSWTVTLIARNDPPHIRASPMSAAYGSRRCLESDTRRPFVGREHQRDGTIVLDAYTHDGSEAAGLRIDSSPAELVDELLVELLGTCGVARLEQTGTAALAHVGEEGELRNDERGTADVDQAQVHLPRLVREHAQVDDLVREPAHRVGVVITCRTHQQHKSAADGCTMLGPRGLPADRADGHALRYHPHLATTSVDHRPGSSRPSPGVICQTPPSVAAHS